MKFIFGVFFITTTLLALRKSSKILVLCPTATYSHYYLAFKLAKELASRDHEITFINAFPQERPIKNLNEISVAEIIDAQNERRKGQYDYGKMDYINSLFAVSRYGCSNTQDALRVKAVQELLKSNKKFDLVVFSHSLNEALLIFPYRFNCSLVILEPLPTTILSNHLFANPSPLSYVPHFLSNLGNHMTFWEILKNIYYEVVGEIFLYYVMLPAQEKLLHRFVPGAPHLQNIIYNSSLMLVNSHISINGPVPLQPAIKEIGGFHIEPAKPLSADIQQFLDDSKEGVIFFSMGSTIKCADFPQERKDFILKIFSNLGQKILWKFEADLPGKPKNLKINKWLPQRDVLAHPNILVFISHGGLLGTLEAVYHGVPLLCMPVVWDQGKNCEYVKRKGFGLVIPFEELTEENFRLALTELINNPKYRENSKMHSTILHDQPMKQMDEAIFWIEYVIRHKGAPHLRSAGLDLKWYQMYLVDIMLFLALISLTCLVVVFYLFRYVFVKSEKVINVKKD